MKFWKKPLVAVLAGVVLVAAVGGTTYAATDGFTKPFSLNNIFGYKETETEQGRIVQVKTDNCSSVALTSAASTSDRTLYFRIAKDAKISTDDALKYVQGYCESLRQPVLPEVYTRLEKRDPARNTPSTLLATNGTVTRADAGTITISGGGAPAETYRKFASDAILESSSGYDQAKRHQGGRNVLLFARPSSSEAPDTVVYVRQASDEETLYLKFSEESSDYRRDVTRVEPCTSDPSGYCAVAQTPKPERPTPAPRTENQRQPSQHRAHRRHHRARNRRHSRRSSRRTRCTGITRPPATKTSSFGPTPRRNLARNSAATSRTIRFSVCSKVSSSLALVNHSIVATPCR